MARMQGLALPSGNRALLIIAALAGLAAAVLFVVAVNNNENGNAGQSSITTGNTVVAVKDIRAGSKIEADMVAIKEAPDDLLVANAFDDRAKVIGQYAAYDIATGEQVTALRIGTAIPPTCGIACVVPPGMVAASFQVKEVTAVGGLLYAGNRVDISPTFKIKNDGSVEGCTQPYILSTQTILQNVQILSVGQQQQEPAGANNTGATDPNSGVSGIIPADAKQQPSAATVTVALRPEDSLKLMSAQERARTVWTSARAAGDTEIRKIDPVNACVYE